MKKIAIIVLFCLCMVTVTSCKSKTQRTKEKVKDYLSEYMAEKATVVTDEDGNEYIMYK